MNKVTTELTAGSKEMEDENFMVLVKLAQAEPNLKLEAVMEGLKFLLLRVRRQYGWGLEEDVERQMERIGVFTALQLWHGSDSLRHLLPGRCGVSCGTRYGVSVILRSTVLTKVLTSTANWRRNRRW